MYQRKEKGKSFQKKTVFFAALFCLIAGLTGCRDRAEEFLKEAQESEFSAQEEIAAQDGASREEKSSEEENVSEREDPSGESELLSAAEEELEKKEIYVDVCGAVANPGVYVLEEESRLFQAVEAAGGFLAEASREHVNCAEKLSDGQQIYVPTKEETEDLSPWKTAGSESPGGGSGEEEKVDINTAGEEQLCTITGIGAAKARAIIAYREANGPFSSIEEIMNVEGIKEGTFTKIKEEIVVR